MNDAEVLRKAAEEIRTRGWHQGEYIASDSDAVCALGALRIATWGTVYPMGPEGYGQYVRCAGKLREVLAEQFPEHAETNSAQLYVPTINDEVCESADEMIGYLEKAAGRLEA